MIEEAHELALRACSASTWTELHQISQILIERETIDQDQFERLLAGEDEGTVFPEPSDAAPERRQPHRRAEARARPAAPRPFPLPGSRDARPGSRQS